MRYSIDQSVVDLRLRSQPLRGDDITTLAGRVQVDPSTLNSSRTIIIAFDGQSTNNNAINGTGTFTNGSKIFNLSIGHHGACFQAVEPLLSSDLVTAGGVTAGHGAMYVADTILTDMSASIDKVVLLNLAIGGSYAMDHSPTGGFNSSFGSVGNGELAYRIGLAARCIANAGLSGVRTILDWQQGEWDSDGGGTTQADYTASMNGYIAEAKNTGLLKPGNVMFVNQCTRISESSANRTPIRAAQAAVCDAGLVRLGADTDTIGTGGRYDGTHFTASGASQVAGLKKFGIENFITNG
jgi:hypothetical protein